ncbi:MAG: sphingomyelin phosphodiesterase [Flavobacteriales bacterium]|nr:sphingomyelin phosphodiesterase [Flavobacteriales bacterium]
MLFLRQHLNLIKIIRFYLAFALVITFVSGTFAQRAGDVAKAEKSLKVLTWNLHLLPSIVLGKHQVPRAKGIAEVLASSDYDVIVFQEAFHTKARKLIWKLLSQHYPYQYWPGNGGLTRFSSGVWVISKLEIIREEKIGYSKCSPGTADCRARKGALFVQVEKGGMTFQIIGTHLQAKGGDKFQLVRNDQLQEVKNLIIDKYKQPGVPIIVMGDLNIAMAKKADYNKMLTILDVENGALSGENQFTSDKSTNDMYPSEEAKAKVIDYVLLNSMGAQLTSVRREVKVFRSDWSKNNKDLSDHYAVEAEISY